MLGWIFSFGFIMQKLLNNSLSANATENLLKYQRTSDVLKITLWTIWIVFLWKFFKFNLASKGQNGQKINN
jgi:peptidoglycan biosynthesis protein MviN/MurJ (putative lipid II flippase)